MLGFTSGLRNLRPALTFKMARIRIYYLVATSPQNETVMSRYWTDSHDTSFTLLIVLYPFFAQEGKVRISAYN